MMSAPRPVRHDRRQPKPRSPKPAKPRTHTVAAGETLAAIARKTGVSLTALEAANPGVNPRKLHVGQTLNLPSKLFSMPARLTFLAIAAFWLTMNVLLWRAEFGAHGGDTPVPVELVWRKILTAPDASSLSVYQNGDRMGYCEFSTSVGQQMAAVDADKPPPEGPRQARRLPDSSGRQRRARRLHQPAEI